jgi:uncharacterized protein (UPF0210 family)
MRIRSLTCFVNISNSETHALRIREAASLARQARAELERSGMTVQTTRLATQPLSLLPDDPARLSQDLWALCHDAGFDYLSLGPVLADTPDADTALLEPIPDLIQASEHIFASVLVARTGQGIHLGAVRRTAGIVREIAHATDLGFGNLRLAMLANVGPHAPFFPAAYHDGGSPALAIAVEAADLAVTAFSQDGALDDARKRLVSAVEEGARRVDDLVRPLTERRGCRFVGLDFSLAPFPEAARSVGQAVEHLGIDRFGAAGTLFAASFLTDCLRRAHYQKCGFNGLMLPVLEDAILASRSHERLFGVNDLLLYSAVCGTGIDTVPLPGETSEEEIAGVLLDVASLALRLDKPLTARPMPIPGARAGDPTEFDFPYFANGHVLDIKGVSCQRIFEQGDWLEM